MKFGMVAVGLALIAAAGPRPALAEDRAPAPPAAPAESPWTVSGSLRVRAESLAGQFRPRLAEHDDVLFTRAILALGYDAGRVRFGAELFDSRAFGQDSRSSVGTSEVNALELVQAYAEVDLDEGGASTLQLGRMTMDLGSKRLVSRQNFRNTTNAYTGVRLQTALAGGGLTAFWVLPHYRLPDDRPGVEDHAVEWDRESTDLQLFGASWVRAVGDRAATLELYGYGLLERDDAALQTRNRRLFTPGFRWRRPPRAGRMDFELEAAGQVGSARRTAAVADTRDLDVAAWFIHAELGRTLDHAWKPRLAAHYDQASGDRGGDRYTRFDPLFGARRFEFGPAGLYGPISRQNLRSPGVRVEIRPSSRFEAMAMYRGLWLDSPTDAPGLTGVADPSGRSGRFAGQQLETRARYALDPDRVWLEVGAARLFKGRHLGEAPNAPDTGDTVFGYADVTVSF
ncbi:alginate export family protein [uncultured Brevundimonas sp.]|uniref:alginate export family protein n=1 Tax=uncultured Brevundimonas sp. TaxID=213418 RepID=UPI002628DEFD|nr:alginate export family protein [uncultured Brevundimonas sp.]